MMMKSFVQAAELEIGLVSGFQPGVDFLGGGHPAAVYGCVLTLELLVGRGRVGFGAADGEGYGG